MGSSNTLVRVATMLAAAMVMVMVMAMVPAEAQTPACASQLVPCALYLNSTTRPPSTCCDPIKEAVTKDLACLCNLYENPDFLKSLGINVTEALRLPVLCGIPADVSACNTGAPSPSQPPPSVGSRPESGVSKIATTGISGLLLVSAGMMLF